MVVSPVPVAEGEITPVSGTMVATPTAPPLHVPPAGVAKAVNVPPPIHSTGTAPIGEGSASTVTIAVTLQLAISL